MRLCPQSWYVWTDHQAHLDTADLVHSVIKLLSGCIEMRHQQQSPAKDPILSVGLLLSLAG